MAFVDVNNELELPANETFLIELSGADDDSSISFL